MAHWTPCVNPRAREVPVTAATTSGSYQLAVAAGAEYFPLPGTRIKQPTCQADAQPTLLVQ
ncbi:MAG TPA: hypothetical protein VGM14_25040 [Streptosporangiaceae bacterium]|jgi:hypothetical protein